MAREKDKAKPTARLTDVEVEEASMVDRAANKRTFLIVKDADGVATPVTPETVALAKWSVEYVNLLADDAFLFVEAGGEKDDNGLTKPLSLRHFAVKDADGKAEVARLQDVIESIAKSDLPQEVKDKCGAAAESLLTEVKAKEQATEAPVEKRGAKMAKDRLKRLSAAVEALGKIVAELQDAEAALEGTEKVAKSAGDPDEPNPLAPQVTELEGKVVALEKRAADAEARAGEAAAAVAKREAEIANHKTEIATQKVALTKQAEMLASARISARPNSSDPTGETAATARPFCWGSDLNQKDSAPKGAQRPQG